MTTPKLQFIVVCEHAFLSAGSNNLNIIGVFSQINAAKFPFNYPRFSLVVNFDTDAAAQRVLATDILDPNGKQIAHTELPVNVTAGNMQVIANFENMQFAIPVEGRDPAAAILDHARRLGITQIFVGHSLVRSWTGRLRSTPLERLVRGAEGIDVRVFPQ